MAARGGASRSTLTIITYSTKRGALRLRIRLAAAQPLRERWIIVKNVAFMAFTTSLRADAEGVGNELSMRRSRAGAYRSHASHAIKYSYII